MKNIIFAGSVIIQAYAEEVGEPTSVLFQDNIEAEKTSIVSNDIENISFLESSQQFLRRLQDGEEQPPEGDDMNFFQSKPCLVTEDCGTSQFLMCKETISDGMQCKHKQIFPIKPLEIGGTIVLTVLMALAVMSGIGGGGIIVPLLMVFYRLNTKEAVAVSGFTILVGSVSRFAFTYKERHPDKDATCIEYGLTNVMLPVVLIGSIGGVFFNTIFPDIMVQISLTGLLGFLAIQSCFKALSIYRKENEADKAKTPNADKASLTKVQAVPQNSVEQPLEAKKDIEMKALDEPSSPSEAQSPAKERKLVKQKSTEEKRTDIILEVHGVEETPIQKREGEQSPTKIPEGDDSESDFKKNVAITNQIIELEKGHLQWKKQLTNVAIFFLLLFVNLFRGSKKNPSLFGIERCSGADWASLIVYVIICGALSFVSVKAVQYEQKMKIEYGQGLGNSDIQLTGNTMIKLLGFSFIGGWVSGALGLGGGSIFNPLFLSMGVPPKVASASGMYMIIFSTGASTMIYIINGMLDISYGMWVGGFCFIGTFLGMHLLNVVMKKLNRQSPLVMLLSFIFIISVIAVPIFGAQQLKGQDDLWTLTNICA